MLVVNVDTRVSVNANSAHVEEAKEFAAFLTQPSAIERFANSQCSFSPLEGNAAPDDAPLQPLAGAFAAGAVVGADDNILLPVWGALRQSVVSLLAGRDGRPSRGPAAQPAGRGGGCILMKSRKTLISILVTLVSVVVIAGTVLFARFVQDSLWEKSVTDVLEVTEQGQHALDTYFGKDLDTLDLFASELSLQHPDDDGAYGRQAGAVRRGRRRHGVRVRESRHGRRVPYGQRQVANLTPSSSSLRTRLAREASSSRFWTSARAAT